jgi:hypothetical protein
MYAAVEEHKPDMALHLGDLVADAEALARQFPGLDVRFVRGNCDLGGAPEQLRFDAESVGIFMVHGHRQQVKYALEPLANAVHFSGAKLGLFGHTHQTEFRKMGGVTLFNPGSVGMGRQSCGLIEVKGEEFKCRLINL